MTNYSFTNVAVLINGVSISGFGAGDDVVQGRRREDAFTDIMGADGNMLVTKNANRSGEFIIRLQQGASSNAYINGLFLTQEAGAFTAAVITVIDTLTGDSAIGTQSYITKPADMTRGEGGNEQEWMFVVEEYNALFPSL
jgi:hypothetical protein